MMAQESKKCPELICVHRPVVSRKTSQKSREEMSGVVCVMVEAVFTHIIVVGWGWCTGMMNEKNEAFL